VGGWVGEGLSEVGGLLARGGLLAMEGRSVNGWSRWVGGWVGGLGIE